MSGKPHERLEAWKSAMELVEEIYRVTAVFPAHEQYGLVSQMRRAAVSIPSNVAEGAGREGNREFSRFLSIARGSLSELDTQHQIAIRLGYVKEALNKSFDKLRTNGNLLIPFVVSLSNHERNQLVQRILKTGTEQADILLERVGKLLSGLMRKLKETE